jgi:phosphatidylserine/phosphatidylglycerophosphate/cardiolipin synthase-like enzyme
VALIDAAKHEIDVAAYVLTDWPVIQALTRAADRGAKGQKGAPPSTPRCSPTSFTAGTRIKPLWNMLARGQVKVPWGRSPLAAHVAL